MANHKYAIEKLIKKNSVQRFAEIGVYGGSTTRYLLRNCPSIEQYFAIDRWSTFIDPHYGRYIFLPQEHWDKKHQQLCQFMLWYSNLHVVKMSSLDFAKRFERREQFFDFVYIDSSHFYNNTLNEIQAYLPLIKKGGIIGGHDYGKNVREAHRGVKIAVDEVFGADSIHRDEDMVWWINV